MTRLHTVYVVNVRATQSRSSAPVEVGWSPPSFGAIYITLLLDVGFSMAMGRMSSLGSFSDCYKPRSQALGEPGNEAMTVISSVSLEVARWKLCWSD